MKFLKLLGKFLTEPIVVFFILFAVTVWLTVAFMEEGSGMVFFIFGIFFSILIPSKMQSKRKLQKTVIHCPNCKYEGAPVMRTKGSFAIELVLWLFFLLPGLIYSLWRVSNRGLICPRCKWEHIVNKKSSKLSVGASLNELSNETINDPLTDDVEHAIQDTVRYLGMKFRVPASVSDRLSSVLTKSVKEGLGLAEVERLIEKIPECTKHEDQANEMALSAMNRIANVSSLKTWTDLGTVKAVKIYSAKDEMVCPACSGWDGKVVRIRDAKVGATHPPFDFCQNVGRNAHCGCRCFGRPEDIAV